MISYRTGGRETPQSFDLIGIAGFFWISDQRKAAKLYKKVWFCLTAAYENFVA